LEAEGFLDEEAFVGAITAIFADIEKMTLERAFLEWMARFHACIETDGEYVN
jgi:hypothetical protein